MSRVAWLERQIFETERRRDKLRMNAKLTDHAAAAFAFELRLMRKELQAHLREAK
jgi:hypothetical protein